MSTFTIFSTMFCSGLCFLGGYVLGVARGAQYANRHPRFNTNVQIVERLRVAGESNSYSTELVRMSNNEVVTVRQVKVPEGWFVYVTNRKGTRLLHPHESDAAASIYHQYDALELE